MVMLTRFLIRLGNEKEFMPADRKKLTAAAYDAVRGLGGDVGNLRVSSSAIEFDLLLDSKRSLDRAVEVLSRTIGPELTVRQLDVQEAPIGDAEAIKLGFSLFNEERYWESHEALEAAWRRITGAEKEILQGIILVSAALVHLQKDEPDITLSIMGRASEKLSPYEGKHFGVDISVLRSKLTRMLAAGQPQFFKIETER